MRGCGGGECWGCPSPAFGGLWIPDRDCGHVWEGGWIPQICSCWFCSRAGSSFRVGGMLDWVLVSREAAWLRDCTC